MLRIKQKKFNKNKNLPVSQSSRLGKLRVTQSSCSAPDGEIKPPEPTTTICKHSQKFLTYSILNSP